MLRLYHCREAGAWERSGIIFEVGGLDSGTTLCRILPYTPASHWHVYCVASGTKFKFHYLKRYSLTVRIGLFVEWDITVFACPRCSTLTDESRFVHACSVGSTMLSCKNRAQAPVCFILLGWAKSRAETLSQEGPTYIDPLVNGPSTQTILSFPLFPWALLPFWADFLSNQEPIHLLLVTLLECPKWLHSSKAFVISLCPMVPPLENNISSSPFWGLVCELFKVVLSLLRRAFSSLNDFLLKRKKWST